MFGRVVTGAPAWVRSGRWVHPRASGFRVVAMHRTRLPLTVAAP